MWGVRAASGGMLLTQDQRTGSFSWRRERGDKLESEDGDHIDDQTGRSRRKLPDVPKSSMNLTIQDGEKNQSTLTLQKNRTEKQTRQAILIMSD